MVKVIMAINIYPLITNITDDADSIMESDDHTNLLVLDGIVTTP